MSISSNIQQLVNNINNGRANISSAISEKGGTSPVSGSGTYTLSGLANAIDTISSGGGEISIMEPEKGTTNKSNTLLFDIIGSHLGRDDYAFDESKIEMYDGKYGCLENYLENCTSISTATNYIQYTFPGVDTSIDETVVSETIFTLGDRVFKQSDGTLLYSTTTPGATDSIVRVYRARTSSCVVRVPKNLSLEENPNGDTIGTLQFINITADRRTVLKSITDPVTNVTAVLTDTRPYLKLIYTNDSGVHTIIINDENYIPIQEPTSDYILSFLNGYLIYQAITAVNSSARLFVARINKINSSYEFVPVRYTNTTGEYTSLVMDGTIYQVFTPGMLGTDSCKFYDTETGDLLTVSGVATVVDAMNQYYLEGKLINLPNTNYYASIIGYYETENASFAQITSAKYNIYTINRNENTLTFSLVVPHSTSIKSIDNVRSMIQNSYLHTECGIIITTDQESNIIYNLVILNNTGAGYELTHISAYNSIPSVTFSDLIQIPSSNIIDGVTYTYKSLCFSLSSHVLFALYVNTSTEEAIIMLYKPLIYEDQSITLNSIGNSPKIACVDGNLNNAKIYNLGADGSLIIQGTIGSVQARFLIKLK